MILSQISKSTDRPDSKASLLLALESVSNEVLAAISSLQTLMSRPHPDSAKLTTIRLQLARMRLLHGSIVYRIAEFLDKSGASSTTIACVRGLQESHSELLRNASIHTTKWSVLALEADWSGYCGETRTVLAYWTHQIRTEGQRLRNFLLEMPKNS